MSRSAPAQSHRDVVVDGPVLLGGGGHDSAEIDTSHDRPDFITTDGVEVWAERPARGTRSHQKTRFVDADGNQVGPVHANLVPAVIWARAQGWRDPGVPDWFNDAAIAEVAKGGADAPYWDDYGADS